MIFVVRLVDIANTKGLDLARGSNADIVARLRQILDFLPNETGIEVGDGIVTINIPESVIQDKSEADRLHINATQRAEQGDFKKAICQLFHHDKAFGRRTGLTRVAHAPTDGILDFKSRYIWLIREPEYVK